MRPLEYKLSWVYNPVRYDEKGLVNTVNYIWILLGVHYQVNSTATINSNAPIIVYSLANYQAVTLLL
jgi:hypothetical protein